MILERARSQRVYITLLGPRNETLTGQLNMTDFQSLGRAGQQDALAAKDDEIKQYDSRGAAYYICVFILVYALAIVMFVASLAKRRRFEQNGDFSRLPKSDILHYYNAEGTAVVIRDVVAGGGGGAAGLEQKRCSKDGTETGVGGVQRSASGSQEVWAVGPKDAHVGTRRKGDPTASTPDELITLVQVLPCGDAGGGGDDDDEPRLDNYYWTSEGKEADEPRGETDQRCRWSIGPDGNLFILQVDENDSCTKFSLEDSRETTCCTRVPVYRTVLQKPQPRRPGSNNQLNAVSANDIDLAGSPQIGHDNQTSCEQRKPLPCSPAEKCTSKNVTGAIAKCNSASLFQQDLVLTDNNYNCDFGNPWGLPSNYPEIQKLLHVTSV